MKPKAECLGSVQKGITNLEGDQDAGPKGGVAPDDCLESGDIV